MTSPVGGAFNTLGLKSCIFCCRRCSIVQPRDWGEESSTQRFIASEGMIGEQEASFSAIYHAIRLTGSFLHPKWENISTTGHGDDAVDGPEVSWKGSVMRSRTEDQLRESLDRMRGLRGEQCPQVRSDGV